ncbi:MAG: kelch repeat-containing protein, partial [Isosphaeraceae bacterium]|nr:kelch repeat-containing protein [Isosphaeraceae bacterium]
RPVGRWETLPPPPFRRRALAAASHAGTLVVLGGLTEIGGVVKTVDFYDPARRTWSRGPDLRGSRLEGFAPSAFEVGGRVYVSGRDGVVRRLNAAGDAWEDVSKLAVPRLTHRLLPGIANDVLAVGGNSAGKPVRLVESVPVGGPRVTPGG